MATGSSEGQSKSKTIKIARETLGLAEEEFYYGEQPSAAPGLFRFLTIDDVRKRLDEVQLFKLHPILLKSKVADPTLFASPSADLSFSNINSCVSVSCVDKTYEGLFSFLPELEKLSSIQRPPPQALIAIYHLIIEICIIYKSLQREWTESPAGAMESSDQHLLWSMICSVVIEGNSAVFKECTVKGETLPHGDIDIVAGRVDNSGNIAWKFGVQLLGDYEFFLQSPIGVSAKIKKTLPTVPPTPQVVVETLAFTEVLQDAAKRSVVFFAGTREAFRPYIRVKELDLLLTTSQSVVWWNVQKNVPELNGVILLIVLMLGVSTPEYNLEIATGVLHDPENAQMKSSMTGWNEYYDAHERKYADKLTAKKKTGNPIQI